MEIGRNSHSTTVVIKNITNISPTGKTHLEWEKIYLLKCVILSPMKTNEYLKTMLCKFSQNAIHKLGDDKKQTFVTNT